MITPTQPTPQANSQVPSAAQSQAASIASDFDTFLLLMTTQAQNQDPLEPMDSTEYAAQLAQFSMVEQQVQSNELLSDLALSLGGIKLEELASWVGMDVQTTAAFHFDGQPVTLSAQAEAAADRAVMVIRDSEGTVIDRMSVSVTQTQFAWAAQPATARPYHRATTRQPWKVMRMKTCCQYSRSRPIIRLLRRRLDKARSC